MISSWVDVDGTAHCKIEITVRQMREMDKEQIAMADDAMWLLRHALRGNHLTGPLALPETKILIRGDGMNLP